MQKYIVSSKRCRFIEDHFFEWSFGKSDDCRPDQLIFNQLNHPAELHYLASIYNWDDGETVLLWILDSQLCTRSTANFLFWRAAPDWYLRCDINDLESCPEFNRAGLVVLKKIVEKYNNNSFSPYQIYFDPAGEIEPIMEKNPKWSFPDGVYDVIDGVSISFES
jgi:Domain of unknown function (DUF4274)